jgi:hypothetical protein
MPPALKKISFYIAKVLHNVSEDVQCSKPGFLTPANGMHYGFGYCGACPWDITGRHFTCLETTFYDHMPEPSEKARA